MGLKANKAHKVRIVFTFLKIFLKLWKKQKSMWLGLYVTYKT